jgi:hypothetical protein
MNMGLAYTTIEASFRVCPFCAEYVNVLEVPATFAAWPELSTGYVVECRSMGCIMPRTRPYPASESLRTDWNERKAEDW